MEQALEGGLLFCNLCKTAKSADDFYRDCTAVTGRQKTCKKCRKSRRAYNRPVTRAGSIVALPDIHFPFHHEGVYAWALDIIAKHQPELIIQLGDLFDLISFTKYPRSHNIFMPRDEIAEARELAVEMWREVGKAAPKAKRVQLKGNHDDRAQKRVIEAIPALESLVVPTIDALFQFDGVKTINSSREEFEYNGILFHHGHQRFGQHYLWNNMNTVNGHLHKGGVLFKQTRDGVIWELNAGFMGNLEAPVFTYNAQKKIHGRTLGIGLIDELGPRFCPYKERV